MPAKKEEIKKKTQTQSSLPAQTYENERKSMHKKAGLLFPAARVLRLMREGRYADRISKKCAIGVAAVLEYLTAEILEMAGDNCFDGEHKKISANIKPRHICLAIKGDEEMNKAIGSDVIIPMGGVIPYIHKELDQKRSKNMRKSLEHLKDDEAQADSEESDEGDENSSEAESEE
jgi:histone H2A